LRPGPVAYWQRKLRTLIYAFTEPRRTVACIPGGYFWGRTSENSVITKFSLPHQPAPEKYLMYVEL
jgi:hypothetical protein